MKTTALAILAAAAFAAGGCATVRVEPIKVEPIHITMDVNVKVERAVQDFFGDLDQKAATIAPTNL